MTGGVQQTGRHFQGLRDDGTTALLFIYFGIWSYLVLVKSIWNVICQEFCWVDRGRWGLKKPTGSKVWEPLGSRNENFTTGVISWKKIKNWLNAFNIHLQTLFSWVNPGSHGDLPTTTCFSIREDDYFPKNICLRSASLHSGFYKSLPSFVACKDAVSSSKWYCFSSTVSFIFCL